MADNAARLDDAAWGFSRISPGAHGREITTDPRGSRASEPRIDASESYYGGASTQPVASRWGLAEFYGERPEPWGGSSVGLTSTQPVYGRHTELLDGPSPALRAEGLHVGSWSDIFDSPGLRAADPASDLGGSDEVDWLSALLVSAGAALAFCWGVVQRHKLASALWAAVIVTWLMPFVVR